MRKARILPFVAALVAFAGAPADGADPPELDVSCPLSHRAPDDPIVHTGHPGASHSHDFFGNRSTNARSSAARLRRHDTTCRPEADRSAYWVPTVRRRGRAVRARAARFYHVVVDAKPDDVVAPPTGLRIVAGTADGRDRDNPHYAWTCTESTTLHLAEMPTCPKGSQLVFRLRFPDCWDGRRLDSPDHQAHMAYHRDGVCPESHPVALPQLRFEIRYPIRGGRRTTLASGPPWTSHGDVIDAWDRAEFKRRLRSCVRETRSCVQGPLADGY